MDALDDGLVQNVIKRLQRGWPRSWQQLSCSSHRLCKLVSGRPQFARVHLWHQGSIHSGSSIRRQACLQPLLINALPRGDTHAPAQQQPDLVPTLLLLWHCRRGAQWKCPCALMQPGC
jgi:hypothetical protein